MNHTSGNLVCEECQSKQFTPYLPDCQDYLTGHSFSVLQCANCGLLQTSPRPENLDLYYPVKYRSYNGIIQALLKFLYARRIKSWCKFFKRPGKVLEIGCGQGFMLKVLQESGWEVAGTERNADAAKEAESLLQKKIYTGDIDHLPAEDTYDLIVLFQVLEHVKKPSSTIAQCARKLAKGGKLIIGVPNSDSWQANLFKSQWFHLDVPRHLFHFTPGSIGKILKNHGLSISDISFVSWEHDCYGWIQSFLNFLSFPFNRLTKLLMKIEQVTLMDFTLLPLIAVAFFPFMLIMFLSWFLRKGAMLCIVAENRETKN